MVYTAVRWRIPGEDLTELNISMVSLLSQSMPVLQNNGVSGLILLQCCYFECNQVQIWFSSSACMHGFSVIESTIYLCILVKLNERTISTINFLNHLDPSDSASNYYLEHYESFEGKNGLIARNSYIYKILCSLAYRYTQHHWAYI